MGPNLLIWTTGKPDLADPASPETLAAAHPAWKEDILKKGPWQPMHIEITNQTLNFFRAATPVNPELIYLCGPSTSSMDVAWFFLEHGLLPSWGSVLAVSQKAGRGQYHRKWNSPPGNIYGAWAWPALPHPLFQLESLLAGVVIATYLEELGLDVGLKWPNDIYINDLKAGGILIEARKNTVLVGIGLNICSAPDEKNLGGPGGVKPCLLPISTELCRPLSLWAGLVNYSRRKYPTLTYAKNPEKIVTEAEKRLVWHGQKVVVTQNEVEPFEAMMIGLAHDGGLRLLIGNKEKVIYSGTIRKL